MFIAEQSGIPHNQMFDVKSVMRKEGRTGHLSRVLSNSDIGLKRVHFDPANQEHRLIFAQFLQGGGWKDGITFHIEAPHLTVPATVINKLIAYHLADELKRYAA
jgi:hypothetical protein